MPDLDELAAWLHDTGHENYAQDLRMATSGDAPAIAYAIADQMDCDTPEPDTETLPAALRGWADTQETPDGTDRLRPVQLQQSDAATAAAT